VVILDSVSQAGASDSGHVPLSSASSVAGSAVSVAHPSNVRPLVVNSAVPAHLLDSPDPLSFTTTLLPLKPPTAELMAQQGNGCANCYHLLKPSVFGIGGPNYCHYTGKLYCSSCHRGDKFVIPAKVVHELDTQPYLVSRVAFNFLFTLFKAPIISLTQVCSIADALHLLVVIFDSSLFMIIPCCFLRSLLHC
jgi:hypothetical protein